MQFHAAIDAGNFDRSAAAVQFAGQLAAANFADDGNRQIGIHSAVGAANVNVGVGFGGLSDVHAAVDAADFQSAFAEPYH